MMENRKAVVIGGGISGLCAAVELKRSGFAVTILERESKVGGVIDTFSEAGFKAESGSNSVMVQSQKTLDFLESIGAAQKLARANPVSKKRFFVRYGKPRAVPMSPISMVFTRLFTVAGKFRLLLEPLVKKFPADAEPSVSEFVERRMGRDVLDYAINPFMAGIYGGNPDRLSIRHAFAPFWNLEQKYGSIIRGAIRSMKEKKATGNFFKPMMISFEGGMKTLVDCLRKELEGSIVVDAKIISIDITAEGWEVSWSNGEEDSCEHFDAAVVAVPAPELKNLPLPGSLAAALKPLDEIEYAPVATFTMGFKREQIKHKLDGFGVLTPEKEKLSILGSLFVSSVFGGRAPEGCITLTNYVGGLRNPEHAKLGREEMRGLVLADLRKLLGLRGEPVFEKMYFWEHAIAQYNVGYERFLELLDNAEDEFPSIAFVGAYRNGVGVSACMENALASARKLSKKIGLP